MPVGIRLLVLCRWLRGGMANDPHYLGKTGKLLFKLATLMRVQAGSPTSRR